MNAFRVFVVASLAVVSLSQTVPTSNPNTAGSQTVSLTADLGQGGLGASGAGMTGVMASPGDLLGSLNLNLQGGGLPNPSASIGGGTPAGAATVGNTNTNNRGGISPLMALLGTGGENPYRALLAPRLGNLGLANQMFFLRGGMDKLGQSMASGMFANMLKASGNVNPFLANIVTSQVMDSPDGWAMMQMFANNGQQQGGSAGGAGGNLFANLFGGGQQQQQQQSGGLLPQGAAAPGRNTGSNNGMSQLFPLLALSSF